MFGYKQTLTVVKMEKSRKKSKQPPEVRNKNSDFLTVNRQEDHNVARLFESSSNLGPADDKAFIETEDSRQQKQNLAIIRNILEMFNLEETQKKYEAQNVVEFVLDPNDFGFDW